MARVVFTKTAREDLCAIRAYIRDELANPSAAKRMIHALRESANRLQAFPFRGRPLSAMIDISTEYRYLVCESYCIFYLVTEREVVIVRVLHQTQDCLKALFMGERID